MFLWHLSCTPSCQRLGMSELHTAQLIISFLMKPCNAYKTYAQKLFRFNKAFDREVKQDEIFEHVAKGVIDKYVKCNNEDQKTSFSLWNIIISVFCVDTMALYLHMDR